MYFICVRLSMFQVEVKGMTTTNEKSTAVMRRRRQVFDAALDLFSRKGFEAVGIREIADQAGVSKSLIGLHFESKEGLRAAVDREVMVRFERMLEATFSVDHHDAREAGVERGERMTAIRSDALPLLNYLRHSLLENSEAGHSMFRRYLDYVGRSWGGEVDALSDKGGERMWLLMVVMFMQLGPILLENHIESFTGLNPYHPASMKTRAMTYSLINEKLQEILKAMPKG